MKKLSRLLIAALLVVSFLGNTTGLNTTFAATSPSLGVAASFAVLADTFTRNVGVTVITGDLGYTTLSGGGTHTVTGSTHVANATYNNAGTDQGTALSALNAQSCNFNYGTPTDLSLLTQPLAPGVYCFAAAASIGTGGITLSGSGTYIFRVAGALSTVANSVVTLANGASSCDVFWTPTSATTLGANSTFKGTNIDASGITAGNNVNWQGRALAFGGTVTMDTTTINSTCATAAVASSSSAQNVGTINVVKKVINDSGRTKTVSDFSLFVNGTPVVSGNTNTFSTAGGNVYTVTETNDPNYTRTFSGDCDVNGQMNLNRGDNKFCIITNDDVGAAAAVVPPIIDIVKVPSPLSLPAGPGSVTYTYTVRNIGTVPMNNVTLVGDTCGPISNHTGDTNSNSILDLSETWIYTCTTTLSATHTNTVVATGWANGISDVDVASATVVVGAPIVPPLIHVTKVPNFLTLFGRGNVMYVYRVTNPGEVAMSNVTISDNKCASNFYGPVGDNGNGLLEVNETWSYACEANLSQTTTNTVAVAGSANGLIARDLAVATVVVAAVPGLPNTGFGPNDESISWSVAMSVGALGLMLTSLVASLRKIAIKK